MTVKASVQTADGFSLHLKADAEDGRAASDELTQKIHAGLKKHFEKIGAKKGHSSVRGMRPNFGSQDADSIDAEDILKYEEARKKIKKLG